MLLEENSICFHQRFTMQLTMMRKHKDRKDYNQGNRAFDMQKINMEVNLKVSRSASNTPDMSFSVSVVGADLDATLLKNLICKTRNYN